MNKPLLEEFKTIILFTIFAVLFSACGSDKNNNSSTNRRTNNTQPTSNTSSNPQIDPQQNWGSIIWNQDNWH